MDILQYWISFQVKKLLLHSNEYRHENLISGHFYRIVFKDVKDIILKRNLDALLLQ